MITLLYSSDTITNQMCQQQTLKIFILKQKAGKKIQYVLLEVEEWKELQY